MPLLGDAITREQICRELEKLPGDPVLRWHAIAARLSGGFCINARREITIDHLTEWIERCALLLNEMSAVRKRLITHGEVSPTALREPMEIETANSAVGNIGGPNGQKGESQKDARRSAQTQSRNGKAGEENKRSQGRQGQGKASGEARTTGQGQGSGTQAGSTEGRQAGRKAQGKAGSSGGTKAQASGAGIARAGGVTTTNRRG
jgi:hypothetical protein